METTLLMSALNRIRYFSSLSRVLFELSEFEASETEKNQRIK